MDGVLQYLLRCCVKTTDGVSKFTIVQPIYVYPATTHQILSISSQEPMLSSQWYPLVFPSTHTAKNTPSLLMVLEGIQWLEEVLSTILLRPAFLLESTVSRGHQGRENTIEGSLEVKLPTIWALGKDGKAEVGRVREETKRSEKKEDAGARKGRKFTMFFQWFAARRVEK